VLDTPGEDSDEWSFDATTSAFRAADILNASKPLQWHGSMEPPDDVLDPIWNGIYRHPLSSAAKRVRSGTASMRPSEKEHSALYDLVQTFAINSLVLNLTVGTRKFPVDWKHIGPGFQMPIVLHKLQRLFNRHLIDASVLFDCCRDWNPPENTEFPQPFRSRPNTPSLTAYRVRRYWGHGIINPSTRCFPDLFRQRQSPVDPNDLKAKCI
jgi:hypothetical protein